MLRKSTLNTLKFTLLIAASALFNNAYSQEKNAPMEAMVQREQGINPFVTVSNIWQADNKFDQKALLTKVSKAQPLTIDYTQLASFIESGYPDVQLVVPKIGGGTYTINLVKYDIFADGFKVIEDANGLTTPFAYTPGKYYRGTVDGIEGSVAAFSFFKNEVYGVFSIPAEGNYNLVPNTMVGNYYDYNQHYLLFNDADLLIKDNAPKCVTDDFPEYISSKVKKTTTNTTEKVYRSCLEIRIYELADYATYLTKGSNSTNVTNYVTALFNNQSTLYRNEGILVGLQTLKINTTKDTYQSLINVNGLSSFYFLQRFANNTQNNLQGADLAVLLTTINGSLGGVAWIQSLCAGFFTYPDNNAPFTADSIGPYAFCNIDQSATVTNFPTYSWDVEVTTHEMGHVLGSPHTHRCCWNPAGTGTTAIDGCYTLEGSCGTPSPQYPVSGGTIMSYCHLTSDGINFSHGFGTQPGDTVRTFTSLAGCGVTYDPSAAIAAPSKTLTANRECTDPYTHITYYFNDNNTAALSDDSVVLMISKNGNNIGTMDNTGFAVSTATTSGFGSGSGLSITFPAGTAGVQAHNIAMRRYWKIAATTQPTTAVEVMFPFIKKDTADVDGSVPGIPMQLTNLSMYKLNSTTLDPNPANGLAGTSASNFNIYTYGSAASTTVWSISIPTGSSTFLAHMKTTNLTGGGTGFCSYTNPLSLFNITSNVAINVYPNPVHDQLVVSIPDDFSGNIISLQLYSIDGKMIQTQSLSVGINNLTTLGLPVGFYYYRILAGTNLFTGNLIKQ